MPHRCSGCRFWERVPAESDVGQCRRYPPQVAELELVDERPPAVEVFHDWPLTVASDWCGEYLSRVLPVAYPAPLSAN